MSDWITIREGDGYCTRAKRLGTSTTKIVVIEWHHPNMGWQDAAVFVRFAHCREWAKVSSVGWMDVYNSIVFVRDYPKFRRLFRD